jgi:hypothetical protein
MNQVLQKVPVYSTCFNIKNLAFCLYTVFCVTLKINSINWMVCVIQMLHVQLQSGNLTFKHYFYEGRSEMIWTQLACGNFVIFRLNTEQLLAQHILLLGYTHTSLPSRRELPDGFTEPIFRGVAISLVDSRLCGFLATVEAPYRVEHSAVCRCFLSTNCR